MRVTRVYIELQLIVGQKIALPTDVVRHLVQVLRLSDGAQVVLFNGNGLNYTATLCDVSKRSASATILSEAHVDTESPLQIHLGQAMSRGDRMDYAIQKAVELGVTSVTPISSEFSSVNLKGEREQKKLNHWRGVIASACEQSGRSKLPALNPVASLSRWCSDKPDEDLGLVFAPDGRESLQSLGNGMQKIWILIGPEGGFSDSELVAAERSGFNRIALGKRILRTETATVATLAILQSRWGDL